jgi:FG-GAP-like repeat
VWEWAEEAADFNNDGHLDLASVNPWDNTVDVSLGDGQGGFGDARQFGVGEYPSSVAVGDFNEDGKLDLAVGNQLSGDVSVLLGHGDGTFGAAESLPTYGNPRSVAVGDFNADGKLDLGVAAYGYGLFYYGYATVHEGDGEGHFAAPKTSLTWFANFNSATAFDLNGDGADDLVIGNEWNGPSVGDVHVFLGDESGYLKPFDVLFIGQDPFYYVTDVAVGDLNGDEVADIITANSYGADYGVSVLLGDGHGGYDMAQGYLAGYSEAISVLVGDFNSDGWIDIGAGSWVLLNDGAWSGLPGDVNSDGAVDIFDINVVSANWGGPGPIGDANHDGLIDIFDINLISANWTGPPNDSISTNLSRPAAQSADSTSVAAMDSTKHAAKALRKTSFSERVAGVDGLFASWHRFDVQADARARDGLAPSGMPDNLLAAHPIRSRSDREIRRGE